MQQAIPQETDTSKLALGNTFYVGDFLIDRNACLITDAHGSSAALRVKVLQVLLMLAEQPGQLISRKQLIDAVWQGNEYTGVKGVTDTISELRRLFGDGSNDAQVIATVPKAGYRLVAAVRPLEPTKPSRNPRRIALLAAACLLLVMTAAWLFGRDVGKSGEGTQVQALRGQLLSPLPGRESEPRLSPDASTVAFVWEAESQSGSHVFLATASDPSPVGPLSDTAQQSSPAWSPNGEQLAFLELTDQGSTQVHVLNRASGLSTRWKVDHALLGHGLDWSPDARSVVFARFDPDSGLGGLVQLDLLEQRVTVLTERSAHRDETDRMPRFSPSGLSVSFVRPVAPARNELWMRELNGEREHLAYEGSIDAAVWINESTLQVLWSGPTGSSIGELALEGGRLIERYSDSNSLSYLDRSGAAWLFSRSTSKVSVRPLSLDEGTLGEPWLESAGVIQNPHHVGESTVFVASNLGGFTLWRKFGNGLPGVLHRSERPIFAAALSPDGRRVAFNAVDEHNVIGLYLLGPDSSDLRRLGDANLDYAPPTWAPDAASLVVAMRRAGGKWNLVQLSVEASDSRTLTVDGGLLGRLTDDGTLYYSKLREPGLRRRDPNSGAEAVWIDDLAIGDGGNWVLAADDAIDYVRRSPDADLIMERAADGQTREIARLPPGKLAPYRTLAIDLASRRLLLNWVESDQADIYLMTD